MSAARPHLSLVLPAHNEEARLPETLPAILAFAASRPYAVEALLVDNASDDSTRAIAEEAAAAHPFLRVLAEPRCGKGAAVRTGVLAAAGEWVLVSDVDLSVPLEEAENFLPPAVHDYDVAIASREAPGAVRYDEPEHRHLMGRLFNLWVRWLLLPGLHDTQCGFKSFRAAAARDLFRRQTLDDWTFDVEILYLARRLGYRIVEVPVHWRHKGRSQVRPGRDALRMAAGVVRVRWNAWRGRYGAAASTARARGASE